MDGNGDETGGREVIKVEDDDDCLGAAVVVVPVTGVVVEFTEGALRFLVNAG
jgi:hypothetical protein